MGKVQLFATRSPPPGRESLWRVAHRFDVDAVGIMYEARVIVPAIAPNARCAIRG